MVLRQSKKTTSEKCHLLINKDCRKKMSISNNIVGKSKCKKLLKHKFDSQLNFEAHIGDLLKKANPRTQQKMKFSIKDFFSKCDQVRSLMRI